MGTLDRLQIPDPSQPRDTAAGGAGYSVERTDAASTLGGRDYLYSPMRLFADTGLSLVLSDK